MVREVKAKPGELVVKWGKAEGEGPDICYAHGDGTSRCDSRLLHNVFGSPRIYRDMSFEIKSEPSLYDELAERGYDLTTLKFSIQKKAFTDKGRATLDAQSNTKEG